MHTLIKNEFFYAVHKKLPLNLMIEIGWKQKMAQDVSYKHYQHKVWLAILVFEKRGLQRK